MKRQRTMITLIRHGQTDWNEAGRLQGHTDIPLNDVGREQAHVTAAYLASMAPDVKWQWLYTSDLSRARATAGAIGAALGLPLHEDPQLRERSLGPLEGLAGPDIAKRFPELAPHWPHVPPELVPPGLETPDVVGERARVWCEAVWQRHPGDAVIAVSHGGWIGNLCERLGYERRPGFRLGNCSVTTVVWGPDGGQVLAFGDTSHFSDLGKAAGLHT